MKEYTYALVLLFTVVICFISSFDKRILFVNHFTSFIKSALIVAVPYILWDVWFTSEGVWWFDTSYTLGWVVAGLPIEEWLFFICIPFSCVFTYFCIDKFFDLTGLKMFNNLIVFVSIIIYSLIALLNYDKLYTFITALSIIISMIYLHMVVHAKWISQASFTYTILMLGFFPVNGVLTGSWIPSAIVNYNPNEFLGIRMLTIPIEDAVYGYAQFLWVLYFFKMFENKTEKL